MSKLKRIAVCVMAICVAGAVVLVYLAVSELQDRREGADYYTEMRMTVDDAVVTEVQNLVSRSYVANETAHVSAMDFDELSQQMPDICGWIAVPETVIDYPVVQGEDNSFYLEHLPDGTENQSGSIMLDAENSSDWTDDISVIHGHHMRAGTMFGDLQKYADGEYAREHSQMILYTPDGDYDIQLVAACVVDGSKFEYCTGFEDLDDRREYIESIIEGSEYGTDIPVADDARLILLSTCAYEFDDARFVVLGILNEKD